MSRHKQECPKCRYHSLSPAYYRDRNGKFAVIKKPNSEADKNTWEPYKNLHGFWCQQCNELFFIKTYDITRHKYTE